MSVAVALPLCGCDVASVGGVGVDTISGMSWFVLTHFFSSAQNG